MAVVNPTLTAIFSLNSEVPKVAWALPSGRLHWHGHRPHAGGGSGSGIDTDSSNVARVTSALIRDAECATTNPAGYAASREGALVAMPHLSALGAKYHRFVWGKAGLVACHGL